MLYPTKRYPSTAVYPGNQDTLPTTTMPNPRNRSEFDTMPASGEGDSPVSEPLNVPRGSVPYTPPPTAAAPAAPGAAPGAPMMRPTVVPPRTEGITSKNAANADAIEADRVRMYARNTPKTAPATSVTPGQMQPRMSPTPAALNRQAFKKPTLPRPTDPDLAAIWDRTYVQPHSTGAPTGNPMVDGANADITGMGERGAVVNHVNQTGGDLGQYQRGQQVQNAQAAMLQSGVTADSMASVGLGKQAKAPLRPSSFFTGGKDQAKTKVVEKGMGGAADVTQADVIEAMNGNKAKDGTNKLSFAQAKAMLVKQRTDAAKPAADAAAAAKAATDKANPARVAALEKELAGIIGDRGGQETIEEPIDPRNPLAGTKRVTKPVNRELSEAEQKRAEEIRAELDQLAGKGKTEKPTHAINGRPIVARNGKWVFADDGTEAK